MLGGGNVETAVISVTFRGADLPPSGRSERVGRPQHDSRHVFPELPLLQHTQSGGKVTVLVLSYRFHAVSRAQVTDIDIVMVIGCGMIGMGLFYSKVMRYIHTWLRCAEPLKFHYVHRHLLCRYDMK